MALTLTATPNPADGTVALSAAGLSVFTSTTDAPTNSATNFGATTGATVSTIGSSVAVNLSADTTAVGSGSATRSFASEVGRNQCVEVEVGAYASFPVEVSLQVQGRGRTDWITLTDDDDPAVSYTRLRFYFQGNASTHTAYIAIRPLYPYMTYSYVQFRNFKVYERSSTFGVYSPDSDTVQITRVDANGTGHVIVPVNDANTTGVLTVTDREAALVGPVVYTIKDTDVKNFAGTQYASATTELHAAPGPDVLPRLTRATTGEDVALTMVTDYGAERQSTGTVHQIMGRPDRVAVTGPLSSRSGTLQLLAPTYDDAQDVIDLLSDGTAVLLRQGDYDGMDMRFVPERVSERPTEVTGLFLVDVTYAEVSGV